MSWYMNYVQLPTGANRFWFYFLVHNFIAFEVNLFLVWQQRFTYNILVHQMAFNMWWIFYSWLAWVQKFMRNMMVH